MNVDKHHLLEFLVTTTWRIAALAVVIAASCQSFAQVPGSLAGLSPHGSYTSGIDKINLGTLNIHIEIPIYKRPSLNAPTQYNLTYDSSNYQIVTDGSYWTPNSYTYGWGDNTGNVNGYMETTFIVTDECRYRNSVTSDNVYTLQDIIYHSPDGVIHTFAGSSTYNRCTNTANTFSSNSGDGYLITARAAVGGGRIVLTDPSGRQHNVGADPGESVYKPVNFALDTNTNGDKGYPYDNVKIYNYGPNRLLPPTGSITYIDSSGISQTVALNYTSSEIMTAFGAPGITESSTISPGNDLPQMLLTSVVYPDGSAYSFTYEPTPGNSCCTTGRLASMTLPTGGTISYQYTGGYGGIELDGSTAGLTRTTSDGVTTYTRSNITSTNGNGSSNTTVLDALGNETDLYFIQQSYQSYEMSRAAYQGDANGTLLFTTSTCYNGGICNPGTPLTGIQTTTTLDDGSVSATSIGYNSYGLPTAASTSQAGTVLSLTTTTYAPLGNNILDRPSEVMVLGGDGQLTDTTYSYDQYDVVSSGSTPSPATVIGARGNLTDIYQVKSSKASNHTTVKYYDTGTVQSVLDAVANASSGGSLTTYTYDASGTLLSSVNVTNPDGSNINGVSHTTSYVYDINQGLLTKSTDVNGQSTLYSYDSAGRITSVVTPDSYTNGKSRNGGVAYCYNILTISGQGNSPANCSNATANSVLTTIAGSPDPDIVSMLIYDSYGRPTSTTQPNGATSETFYDSLGRVQSISNPHTQNASTAVTSFLYDALGRKRYQCQPDNGSNTPCVGLHSYREWTYSGRTITSKDEAGNVSKQTTDALGRLIQATEPGSLITGYVYDGLGNLLCVEQHGGISGTGCDSDPLDDATSPWRVRRFSYNSLSQLISASNPETGTVGYSYDANSNLKTKTDARGITVTYGYDAMNRLTSKNYPSATSSSCYQYDSSSIPGAGGNLVGRLSNSWTQNGVCPAAPPATGMLSRRSILAYDAMGRPLSEQQCTRSNCGTSSYSPSYTYDLAGNALTQSNGAGNFTFTNSYDLAAQLSSVTSSNTLYPTSLFSLPVYNSAGGMTDAMFGTGLKIHRVYDSRFRITGETDTGSSAAKPASGSATITITGSEQTN